MSAAGAGGGGEEVKTDLLDEFSKLMVDAGGADITTEASGAIRKNDVLVVVDFQNDFVPEADAPGHGRFGVAEGASASGTVISLIEKFTAAGAVVIATRDYHPADHCSFATQGGPFPPHCIQGSDGSKFFPPIGEALTTARKSSDNVHIVFKGFCEDIDSFGAFKYPESYATTRVSHKDSEPLSCTLPWTGAYKLKCSNATDDINAPPDVLAVTKKISMADLITEATEGAPNRIFVTGLALDFCVLDTALTGAAAGLKNIHIVKEACRAAHIPGVGGHGTGFLSDPSTVVSQCSEKGVKFCSAATLLA